MRQTASRAGFVLSFAIAAAVYAPSQSPADPGPAAADSGRILLVLPFDNRTSQPSLEWIREAAPELLSSRFRSAGFEPMSRADRMYALDHLGLPQGFHPSRASSLKLAQTLDADSIIVGSYITDGTGIVAEAEVVDVPHLRMSRAVTAHGEMRDLVAVFDTLAWELTRQLDPSFNVAEETFVAAGAGLRLDAFEQYIRGISEPDQAERLHHLQLAVQLSPALSQAWMALGREDYLGQQYDQAAAAFAKVSQSDPDSLEAGFYRGLSLVFSGDYPRAEQTFGAVARVLPLAEVLNNQGVAVDRQGHDGSELFRQAVTADPNVADYHFNLAVSLNRHGRTADALAELAQCLKLRPNDSEAQDLLAAWKPATGPATTRLVSSATPNPDSTPASGPASSSGAEPKADPLERIARNFDAGAFRQAALMLDQMDASRLASLTPRQRAEKLSAQAKDFLDRGLLLEAERLYQAAVAADGSAAGPHAGLAEVRERTGDAKAARKEAQVSLQLEPSAQGYLVLGRLDLAAGRFDEANTEARQALKLAPGSQVAQELLKQILARVGQKN